MQKAISSETFGLSEQAATFVNMLAPKKRNSCWGLLLVATIAQISLYLLFSRLNPLYEPAKEAAVSLGAAFPRVDALMQKSPQRSRGEVLRIHHPLVLGKQKARPSTSALQRMLLNCTDFSKSLNVRADTCLQLLTPRRGEHVGSSFPSVVARSPRTAAGISKSCNTRTAVIVPLHYRDKNVCHFLMKLLFAFTVYQRALHTPGWLGVPPVQTVVVLASRSEMALFRPPPRWRSRSFFPWIRNKFFPRPKMPIRSFHAGLLEALFTQHGVDVVIRHRLDDLKAPRRCFAAGVFVGSHANRFSFPDAILGANSSYYGASPLRFPLSSDALALREHVFKNRTLPERRFKLLYVARTFGHRRTWTRRSEPVFVSMVQDVSRRNGAEFSMFFGGSSTGFMQQVSYYADASVIIGFHGAGLALGAFAPRGAKIIEIEPEYHLLGLFGNLQSSGLSYERIRLSKGSSRGSRHSSELIPDDKKVIESALEASLQSAKAYAEKP